MTDYDLGRLIKFAQEDNSNPCLLESIGGVDYPLF